MKIAFFTEMGFRGKVPRQHTNMRVEFAWMASLQADHFPLGTIPEEQYDLALVLNSKTRSDLLNISELKQVCAKVAILQEGPFWYFQDYELPQQIHYYNNLVSADIIYTHNEQDRKYYQGVTNHPDVRVIPSVMVEDPIGTIHTDRSGIMIGGNFKSWYGGFDSFMIASSVTDEIYSPQMGRRSEGEDQLGINQLPYLEWNQWITELSKRKIGVHLMRTHAAGTFALNCSYLGIPCIGYTGLDTQRLLHPNLTVEDGDLITARKMLTQLWEDEEFYKEQSKLTKENYSKLYSEQHFLNNFL